MIEQNTSPTDQEIKVSSDKSALEQYQDLSGISIKKLNLGLWWVVNAKFFKKTLFWFVVVLGIASWFYTIINFGYYLTIGANKDDVMLRTMTTAQVNKQVISPPISLSVGDVEIFSSSDNRFDFIAPIANNNPSFYAEFDYAFEINGTTTLIQTGFILPKEQKNLVSLGVVWPENISSVRLQLNNIKWRRIDRHKIEDWDIYKNQHLAFDISEPKFNTAEDSGLTEKMSISEISFIFTNSSPYNYYQIPLNIFLYSSDSIVGVYQTSLVKVGSGETRSVELSYSGSVGRVDRISVVPDLDIMKPDIYFKFIGTK